MFTWKTPREAPTFHFVFIWHYLCQSSTNSSSGVCYCPTIVLLILQVQLVVCAIQFKCSILQGVEIDWIGLVLFGTWYLKVRIYTSLPVDVFLLCDEMKQFIFLCCCLLNLASNFIFVPVLQ